MAPLWCAQLASSGLITSAQVRVSLCSAYRVLYVSQSTDWLMLLRFESTTAHVKEFGTENSGVANPRRPSQRLMENSAPSLRFPVQGVAPVTPSFSFLQGISLNIEDAKGRSLPMEHEQSVETRAANMWTLKWRWRASKQPSLLLEDPCWHLHLAHELCRWSALWMWVWHLPPSGGKRVL